MGFLLGLAFLTQTNLRRALAFTYASLPNLELLDDITLLTADELRQAEIARSLFPEAQIKFFWVTDDRSVHYHETYGTYPANYPESARR
jgi:hypothetical protein